MKRKCQRSLLSLLQWKSKLSFLGSRTYFVQKWLKWQQNGSSFKIWGDCPIHVSWYLKWYKCVFPFFSDLSWKDEAVPNDKWWMCNCPLYIVRTLFTGPRMMLPTNSNQFCQHNPVQSPFLDRENCVKPGSKTFARRSWAVEVEGPYHYNAQCSHHAV